MDDKVPEIIDKTLQAMVHKEVLSIFLGGFFCVGNLLTYN